jgi:hypothetical protein
LIIVAVILKYPFYFIFLKENTTLMSGIYLINHACFDLDINHIFIQSCKSQEAFEPHTHTTTHAPLTCVYKVHTKKDTWLVPVSTPNTTVLQSYIYDNKYIYSLVTIVTKESSRKVRKSLFILTNWVLVSFRQEAYFVWFFFLH